MTSLQLVAQAEQHAERIAIVAPEGTFRYRDLLDRSKVAATRLLAGSSDLAEARVAMLVPPGFDYVAVQWAIWQAGGVAVPLAVSYPPAELAYVLADTGASAVVAHPDFAESVRPFAEERGLRLVLTPDLLSRPAGLAMAAAAQLPAITADRRAMILFTSGTTSRPKGVVTTHGNIEAQVKALVEAWEWQADDHIPLILPLHHVHGIINVLTCALWSGAKVTILPRFDADAVWKLIARGELTLFMAVPTVYSRLIATWDAAPPERQSLLSVGCLNLRLMVSGSAALPVTVLHRWREISGHTLLERYGMTEIGMALSNPLHGDRRPGFVGIPLPGADVRLVDEAGVPVEPGIPGEVLVRGLAVFHEYWQRPEATAAAFRDGWFRTGDVAIVEDGYYRILGRSSVDIIKTGGYKVSALEIEAVFHTHPAIAQCAVVGVADPEWGQRVALVAVLRSSHAVTLEGMRKWAAEHLAPYKLPTRLLVVADLPRNAMGKVTKPALAHQFAPATQD